MKHLLIIMLVILLSSSVFSSEEYYLNWNSVSIKLVTPDKQKSVIVEAIQNKEFSYEKFIIKIEGKDYKLNKKQLEKLKGYWLNSIKLTHEAGYVRVGGYTIHVKLFRSFYREKKLIRKKLYISINKKGLGITEYTSD